MRNEEYSHIRVKVTYKGHKRELVEIEAKVTLELGVAQKVGVVLFQISAASRNTKTIMSSASFNTQKNEEDVFSPLDKEGKALGVLQQLVVDVSLCVVSYVCQPRLVSCGNCPIWSSLEIQQLDIELAIHLVHLVDVLCVAGAVHHILEVLVHVKDVVCRLGGLSVAAEVCACKELWDLLCQHVDLRNTCVREIASSIELFSEQRRKCKSTNLTSNDGDELVDRVEWISRR